MEASVKATISPALDGLGEKLKAAVGTVVAALATVTFWLAALAPSALVAVRVTA